jgi:hypothetical protein
MGSRLLPLCLALGATFADLAGAHRLSSLVLLGAIVCAAGAAIVAVGDLLDGRPARIRAVTSGGALALLVLGSAVREGAVADAAIPAVAVSAVIAAAILYVLPVLFWILQPAPLVPARAELEEPGEGLAAAA